MKFTKLRLVGFKSFVEPSEFIIERGLTGVVGPNGCGKSNLVEALRWVMGENSYKNMRASGMDDVIFSGSGHRPARNSAEVGLYLDNSDRTAPAAFNDSDEIQVSRRIERESGSVYRINGKEARAKDVQLLFADASTGARSPSMVGQGRIGELIQAKPQARRQLLEEAAGISGLHSRRHEAELRLRGAETNLERLDDVTSQLKSQIESLKRQARQANRFKTLSAEIRAREALLLHMRWVEAKQATSDAESQLNQITSLVAEKAQAQMEAVKTQAIASLKLPELREEEARAAATLQRLQIARSQLDDDAARILRRRDELTHRLSQLAQDIAREEKLVGDNAQALERLDDEEADLAQALDDAGDEAAEAAQILADATEKLRDSESILLILTAERAQAQATRTQVERAIRDLDERQRRAHQQVEAQGRERDAVASQLAALPDPQEKREALDAAQAALQDAEARLSEAEDRLEQARATEASARPPVDQARAALAGLETEARTIDRMLEAGQGSDGARPIVDELSVDRGFEAALGAALGADLDSPADTTAVMHWRLPGDGSADAALPPGVKPLSDHVQGPTLLARRLAQVGVVDYSADAERIFQSLCPGQMLVTPMGDVWRWDGHVTGADAPSSAAIRLEQKNRLAELEALRETAEIALETAEAALRRTVSDSAAWGDRQRQMRDETRDLSRSVAHAHDDFSKAERAAGDLLRRQAVLAETLGQLTSQLDDFSEQAEAARNALADAPNLCDLDLRLKNQTADVGLDRATLAQAQAAYDGLARENEDRKRRLVSLAQERQRWASRAASADEQIATLHEREAQAREEAEEIEAEPDAFDERRFELMNALSKAETGRRAASDRLVEAETSQREADARAATALAELAESREKRGRAEERLIATREKRLESEARIREVLQCAPYEALRLAYHTPDAPMPNPFTVERELDRLKIERERLGAVNLLADEEQADLSAKLASIIREREDIIDAIRKLRAAIQSLNREGRERLLAAFDVVNAQFQRLFTHLFNGGTAELQLIESDDPLDAGLEILARPPGKKPQTMTLLSGGEQALTAMALIFAVFLTNPAPICVLDEVDAPLDDHNVERYCNLMDEMAATTETRFIIITHNPITMARMNRLFGVTMAEQGVSQLVSVDLQAAERLVEIV